MARIIYEDALHTEYDDGREEVRFTEKEWEIMLRDPAFGYVLKCGHSASQVDSCGDCRICEGEMQAAQYE